VSEGPDRQGHAAARGAGGRITSVRQLGGSVRRRLSRHPLAETGLIVAGDAILSPAAGADAGGRGRGVAVGGDRRGRGTCPRRPGPPRRRPP